MNKKVVFDTGALSLHFADHPGVREFFDSVFGRRSVGLISSFNLAEFYYKTCQKLGKQTADARYFQLQESEEFSIIYSDDLVRAAGLEKCQGSARLSLADCFALALTKKEKALLVTTDSELARVKDVEVRHIEL
jgi:uncharacterized protein